MAGIKYLGADGNYHIVGTGAGLEMVKLWENASPTSSFAAQFVPLSLQAGDKVLIKLIQGTGDLYKGVSYQLCDFDTNQLQAQTMHLFLDNAGLSWAYRACSISSDGISFGGGAYKGASGSGAAADNYCMPLAIYVLRG